MAMDVRSTVSFLMLIIAVSTAPAIRRAVLLKRLGGLRCTLADMIRTIDDMGVRKHPDVKPQYRGNPIDRKFIGVRLISRDVLSQCKRWMDTGIDPL